MKILRKQNVLCSLFSITTLILANSGTAAELSPQEELKNVYARFYKEPSDTNEHLPILRQLASEGSSVTEIGLRFMVSSWDILHQRPLLH